MIMTDIITTSLKRVVITKITDGPHTTPQLVDEGIPFISAEGIVEGKIDFSKKRGFIKRKDHIIFSQKLLPRYGDIFFVKSGSTTGKIAIVETKEEFNVWSPLALIRTNDLVNNKLLYYILQSPAFQLQVRQYWSFGTQPNIGMNKIEQLKVTFPKSKNLQEQIVSYLDLLFDKTNHFINSKQRFVELLKEQRQSIITNAVTKGIDVNVKVKETAVGEIPEHWEIRRLASIGRFSKGGNISRSELLFSDDGLPAILYGDIYTKYDIVVENVVNRISPATATKSVEIRKGDLLFTGSGETIEDIGKCILFNSDIPAYAGGDVIIFKQDVFDSYFISYSQNSSYAKHQKAISSKGEIIVHTYGSKLRDVIMPYPPRVEEQKKIVEHIKTETRNLDIAISKAKREIELIKEYREAMIAEAIVGKIKF